MLLPPDLKPAGILIYLLKSRTDDPALSVTETLAKHEQMLDEWCERNLGGRVPEENRFREVVSGASFMLRVPWFSMSADYSTKKRPAQGVRGLFFALVLKDFGGHA